MDKDKKIFKEQDAPLKNTDRACVKVKRDGSPEMPQSAEHNEKQRREEADLEQQRKETLTERD